MPSLLQAAEEFLGFMVSEGALLVSQAGSRLQEIETELESTGSYTHTTAELAFGARLAWRNNSRCIGRLVWRQLAVRDFRTLGTPEEIFQACLDHLRDSTNGGRIVPLISVFQENGPRILNRQLIRYADDPAEASFVKKLAELGWQPKGERFEVLPLAIEWPGHETLMKEIPSEAVLEVQISHPDFPWFAELGIRWHALPAVSDQTLEIGGIRYDCAPFSGWYMGTEIGARNLADTDRYDYLPLIARKMELEVGNEASLWRDRALVELNRAVLHSYAKAGVTIVDHHTASRQFLQHLELEQKANRSVSADWAWIVPPMSGAATKVFHTPMRQSAVSPDFHPREKTGPAVGASEANRCENRSSDTGVDAPSGRVSSHFSS